MNASNKKPPPPSRMQQSSITILGVLACLIALSMHPGDLQRKLSLILCELASVVRHGEPSLSYTVPAYHSCLVLIHCRRSVLICSAYSKARIKKKPSYNLSPARRLD